MTTFQDLIKKGVAPSPYKTVANQSVFDGDKIIINYNNIWGCISDTHMGKTEDGTYIITGQLFRDRAKTQNFVNAFTWGNYAFKNCSGGWTSLNQFAQNNHLIISHEIVNGDNVLVLRPFNEEQIEYYEKYLAAQATGIVQTCADYDKREKAEQHNIELARSFNFQY